MSLKKPNLFSKKSSFHKKPYVFTLMSTMAFPAFLSHCRVPGASSSTDTIILPSPTNAAGSTSPVTLQGSLTGLLSGTATSSIANISVPTGSQSDVATCISYWNSWFAGFGTNIAPFAIVNNATVVNGVSTSPQYKEISIPPTIFGIATGGNSTPTANGSAIIADAITTTLPTLVKVINPVINVGTGALGILGLGGTVSQTPYTQTYNFMNPNGWYCINTDINIAANAIFNFACGAHIAASDLDLSLNIPGISNGNKKQVNPILLGAGGNNAAAQLTFNINANVTINKNCPGNGTGNNTSSNNNSTNTNSNSNSTAIPNTTPIPAGSTMPTLSQ